MTETWTVIAVLAVGTFAIRLAGVLVGRRIRDDGAWARGLRALPGCLIVGLVSISLLSGGPREWGAGAVAAAVAVATRSLPLTMVGGIAAVFVLRHVGS
ncbi:MAG: AzlD family protein [Janthinobacterium lividum]